MIRNETECQEASKRAAKILDALHVRTQVAIEPLPPFATAQAS
jgi:hypothetical protein